MQGIRTSLKRTGSNTCLLTKYSCHMRLAGESATSGYVNQRCFLLVAEYALRPLYPTFCQILMWGLAVAARNILKKCPRYSASHVQADRGTHCPVSAPPCTPSRAVKLPAVEERFAWLWLGFYLHSARGTSFPCCLETEPLISPSDQHALFLRTKRTGGGRKSFCIKRTFWQNSAMNCSAQLEPRWWVRGLLKRRL